MKKSVFASLLLAILPGMAMAQSVDDDLYYTPKKSTKKSAATIVENPVKEDTIYSDGLAEDAWTSGSSIPVVVRDRKGNVRDVDEYNRRYTSKENNFSVENDTLYIDEREDSDLGGEWINGFDGTEDDYEYAMRLIRFRNPRYAIPVSSPLYWDIVYAQAYLPWDWNVYDDGMYAYIFPTFSNRLWWNWRYSPYSWWYWDWWDYPYYYSWYSSWYWGWGGWYAPYHHHSHWYAHAPMWGGGGHWARPANARPVASANVQRGHNRSGRFDSGTDFSATRASRSADNRYSGTRVDGSSASSGRFNGVQGFRSTSSSSVRSAATRSQSSSSRFNSGSVSGTRSTSSYVRPNSVRSNNNTYSRPSSTRSSSNANTRSVRSTTNNSYRSNTNSNYSRSFNQGSSVRSSGFSTGGGSRSVGGGGGARSGGSRR